MGKHLLVIICLVAGLMGALAPRSVQAWGGPQGVDRVLAAVPSYLQYAAAGPATSSQQAKPSAANKSAAASRSSSDLCQEAQGFFSGGVLAQLVWSRMCGYSLNRPGSESWPFGFLDMVALGVILFLGYRVLHPVKPAQPTIPPPRFKLPPMVLPIPYSIEPEAEEALARIGSEDPDFNLASFLESAYQVVFDLHAAWNLQELERIQDRVTSQMLAYLQMGQKLLKMKGETSRVEDVVLSRMVVSRVQHEPDRDIITVLFEGKALDYLLEKKSLKLQSGSMTYPIDLNELWSFRRLRGQRTWLLKGVVEA